ncbi:MAG: J domain-containing protein [Dehalococcoidia bacterium]
MTSPAGEPSDPAASSAPTWYEALEVPPWASAAEITQAYERRKLLLDVPPDGPPASPEAIGQRGLIEEAYRVLADPQRRAQYDRVRGFTGTAPASAAPAGGAISARRTVAEAWRLLVRHPAAIILPQLAVEAPVALVLSALTTILWFTAFANEPFIVVTEITRDVAAGLIFTLVAVQAATILFSQVARGATILAAAAAFHGRPQPVAASLDPAFTRMGGLIVQALILGAALVSLAVSVVGIVLLPFAAARFGVSTEILLLEKRGPIAALRGSWQLMSGQVLRFLVTIILAILAAVGPFLVITLLLELGIAGDRDQQVITYGIVSFVQVILLAPVVAFLTTVTTLFYLKVRSTVDAQPAA